MSFLPGMRGLIVPPAPDGGGGLLDGSEDDGTNLLTAGNVGMTSGWTGDQATLSTAAGTAPDGTTTAALLTENSASGTRHRLSQTSPFIDYSIPRTFSVYAKANGRRYLQLGVFTGRQYVVYADLQDGVITDDHTPSGTAVLVSADMYEAEEGFWKIVIVVDDIQPGDDSPSLEFNLSDVGTYGSPLWFDRPAYDGDGSSGVYLWRPKLT